MGDTHITGRHIGGDTHIKQLLDEVEHDIMNYQNRGLCYLPKPKAEADNTAKLSSQTENYVKILGYKTHQKIESYQKNVMTLRTIILTRLACKLFLLT